MPEARVVGMTLLNRNLFLAEVHGPNALSAVLARLPKAVASDLRLPLASQWYPLSELIAIDHAIVAVAFGGDLRRVRELGRYNLEKNVGKVYRFLFRFMEPTFLVKKGAEVWPKMVDQGRVTLYPEGTNKLRLVIQNLDPIDELYCEVLAGSFEGSFKACGVSEAKVEHTRCVLRGDPELEFTIRW